MKLLKLGLFAVLMSFFASCSNDSENVTIPDSRSDEFNNPGLAYFEAVTAPEVWVQFKTGEDMLKALNLPKDVLNKLTTEQLVECCKQYPLWISRMAYNDPCKGTLYVMDNFNGFSALRNRERHAEYLLDAYELLTRSLTGGVDVSNEEESVEYRFNKTNFDYMFAVEYYPEVLKGENGLRLRSIIADFMSSDEEYAKDELLQNLLKLIDKYSK